MYDLTVTFGLGVSSSQTITTRIALGREFLVRTTDMQGSTWTIQGVVWSALFGKFTAQLKLSEWWSEASHTEFGMEPELELGQPFSIGSGAVIRMRTVLLQEAKPSAPDPLANPLGRHQNEQTPTPVLKR